MVDLRKRGQASSKRDPIQQQVRNDVYIYIDMNDVHALRVGWLTPLAEFLNILDSFLGPVAPETITPSCPGAILLPFFWMLLPSIRIQQRLKHLHQLQAPSPSFRLRLPRSHPPVSRHAPWPVSPDPPTP